MAHWLIMGATASTELEWKMVETYLEGNSYHNCGDSLNDHPVIFMLANLPNCYDISTCKVTASVVFTDLPSNTWCRSPGTTEGIAFIENIMEHIAKELGKDPIEVKLKNLAKNEERIADMVSYWKTKSDYSNRVVTVQDFNKILHVDILEDAGGSLSPEIDLGQVEGAFVMGLGYWLKEFMVYDNDTGKALTNRTWNYKPPGAKDIPIDFRIQLRKNAPNPVGVLCSKATGKPPLCMSICALFAIQEAVLASRQASAHSEKWFEMSPPATPKKVFLASLTNYKQFEL